MRILAAVEYFNIYRGGNPGGPHNFAAQAHRGSLNGYFEVSRNWLRVDERWNGHWLRPCVGMRADEASHKYVPQWRKSCIWRICEDEILITRSSPQKFVML